MKKLFFAGLAIFLIFTGYRFYAGSVYAPLSPGDSSRVIVTIESGASAGQVAEQLYEKGLIKSPLAFKFYVRQRQAAAQIKAGRFVLSPGQTLPAMLDALLAGGSAELPVTLLEGWTAAQIAAHLEKAGLGTADEFLDCFKHCNFDEDFLPAGSLEGTLYPDTYFVDPSSFSPERFISRLLRNFDSHFSEQDRLALKKSGRTLADTLVMASIVEREERDPAERPVVAGILWNRLDAGMGLAADATILYALGRTKGGLTREDLAIDSPYNTRKYRGLPPTPISNPSIDSIRAALTPQKTDYFYYLHDATGAVHYGRTLEEHNVNKARYL